jgi:ABC-type glycerol-3-phosphate transport system substrate-binding protein
MGTSGESLLAQPLSRRQLLGRGAGAGLLLSAGGLLAACGDSGSKAATTGEASGSIRFLKGPNWADDLKWERKIAAAFTAEHPKIKVTPALYDWASVETQLTTAFASNSPPDIVYMADTLWPKFADAGALLDLSDYVDDPAFAAEKGKYPDGAWEAVTYDGKVFGVPLILGVISVVYLNMDLLRRAGVKDAVSSYDAMRTAAQATRKGDVFGYGMTTTHNDFSYQEWMNYVVNSGAAILGEDGRSGGFDTPENAQAFELLRAIHAEDKSAPPPGSYNREALKGLFQAGRVAIYHSDANEKIITGKAEGKPVKFPYEVHKLPPGPAGQFVFTVRGNLHIAAKSKSPDAAWEYVRYLSSAQRETEFIRAQGGDLQPARSDISNSVYPAGAAFDWSRRLVKEFIPDGRSVQPHPRMIEMIKAVQTEFERCIRGQQTGAEMVAAANGRINELA